MSVRERVLSRTAAFWLLACLLAWFLCAASAHVAALFRLSGDVAIPAEHPDPDLRGVRIRGPGCAADYWAPI